MNDSKPAVSIVIPIFNEIGSLPEAYRSLRDSGYPAELLEFLFVDGGSTDGTRDYLAELASRHENYRIIDNPERITPVALNLGISAARHEIILRADAHAVYGAGYIKYSVESLVNGSGDNVGGVIRARRGRSRFSETLALVLNSPFGNGGASYRSAEKSLNVETVWCGCWYKKTLIQVGMFDVSWPNNQDAELNARLISRGFRVYLNHKVKAELIVRENFWQMIRQYFNYGKGRVKTLFRYPALLKLRQLLPFFGVFLMLYLLVAHPVILLALLLSSAIFFYIYFEEFHHQNMQKSAFNSMTVLAIVLGMNFAWVGGCVYGMFEKIFGGNADQQNK